MAKKDRIKTGMEYMLQMKEYLGDDKMAEYVEQRFPHRTNETKRGMIHAVNAIHAAKHSVNKTKRPTL